MNNGFVKCVRKTSNNVSQCLTDEKKLKFETFLSDSLIWTDFSQTFTIDNVVEIVFELGLTPITNNCSLS
jgi:hypothetical protein